MPLIFIFSAHCIQGFELRIRSPSALTLIIKMSIVAAFKTFSVLNSGVLDEKIKNIRFGVSRCIIGRNMDRDAIYNDNSGVVRAPSVCTRMITRLVIRKKKRFVQHFIQYDIFSVKTKDFSFFPYKLSSSRVNISSYLFEDFLWTPKKKMLRSFMKLFTS